MIFQRLDDKKAIEDYDTLLAKTLPLVERELGREVAVEELEKVWKPKANCCAFKLIILS